MPKAHGSSSGGGGGGTPSSPDRSIQFNNGGVFGGSADLTWIPGTSASPAIDSSPSADNGIPVGNAQTTTDCILGTHSGHFLGGGTVTGSPGPMASLTTSFTVAAWIKTTNSGDAPFFQLINVNYPTLSVGLVDGNGIQYASDGDGTINSAPVSPGGYHDGDWHYITVTLGGSQVSFYYDGVLLNQTFAPGGIQSAATKYAFGNFGAGQLDELSVWDYTLSDGDVTAQFNSGAGVQLTGSESGLVGLWHMDEAAWEAATGNNLHVAALINNQLLVDNNGTTIFGGYQFSRNDNAGNPYIAGSLGLAVDIDTASDETTHLEGRTLIVGHDNISLRTGSWETLLGGESVVGYAGTVVGSFSNAGDFGTVCGSNALSGQYGFAGGYGAVANGPESVVLGHLAIDNGAGGSVLIGANSLITGESGGATVIGSYSSGADGAAIVGAASVGNGFSNVMLFGNNCTALGDNATAIGFATSAGAYAAALGVGSAATGYGSLVFGNQATDNGFEGCLIFGTLASATSTEAIAFGAGAMAGNSAIAIGSGANASDNGTAIGFYSYAPSGWFVSGSPRIPITDVVFGSGISMSDAPAAWTLHGCDAPSRTNYIGADLRVMGGRGTGAGTPGAILFALASVGVSSSTQQIANDIIKLTDVGLAFLTVGGGLAYQSGVNARAGVTSLVAGTQVIANTSITANSIVNISPQQDGGTVGSIRCSSKTVGVGFTITSTSALDTSTVAWTISELN